MFSKTKPHLVLPFFVLFCLLLTGAKSTEKIQQQQQPGVATAPAPIPDILPEIEPLEYRSVEQLSSLESPSPVVQQGKSSPGTSVDLPAPETAEEAIAQLDMSQLTFKQKIAVKLLRKRMKKEAKVAGTDSPQGGKSQLVALLLCLFVGLLGIHRFYLGYTGAGVIQLLTGGLCGIWTLIDFIRLCVGDLQPKNGSYDEVLGSGGNSHN